MNKEAHEKRLKKIEEFSDIFFDNETKAKYIVGASLREYKNFLKEWYFNSSDVEKEDMECILHSTSQYKADKAGKGMQNSHVTAIKKGRYPVNKDTHTISYQEYKRRAKKQADTFYAHILNNFNSTPKKDTLIKILEDFYDNTDEYLHELSTAKADNTKLRKCLNSHTEDKESITEYLAKFSKE